MRKNYYFWIYDVSLIIENFYIFTKKDTIQNQSVINIISWWIHSSVFSKNSHVECFHYHHRGQYCLSPELISVYSQNIEKTSQPIALYITFCCFKMGQLSNEYNSSRYGSFGCKKNNKTLVYGLLLLNRQNAEMSKKCDQRCIMAAQVPSPMVRRNFME